jgi:hypothetical protein
MTLLTFVETRLFTKLVEEYLSDDEYAGLQQALVASPEAAKNVGGHPRASAEEDQGGDRWLGQSGTSAGRYSKGSVS